MPGMRAYGKTTMRFRRGRPHPELERLRASVLTPLNELAALWDSAREDISWLRDHAPHHMDELDEHVAIIASAPRAIFFNPLYLTMALSDAVHRKTVVDLLEPNAMILRPDDGEHLLHQGLSMRRVEGTGRVAYYTLDDIGQMEAYLRLESLDALADERRRTPQRFLDRALQALPMLDHDRADLHAASSLLAEARKTNSSSAHPEP